MNEYRWGELKIPEFNRIYDFYLHPTSHFIIVCTKAECVIVIATEYRMQPAKTTTEQNPSNQYLLDTYQKLLHLTKVW